MSDCTLILPHQLFDPHPAVEKDRAVFFVEDGLTFGDPHVSIKFHKQKLVLLRGAMKAYASNLADRGYDVRYIDHCPDSTISDHLRDIKKAGFDTVHLCDPVDYLMSRRLNRASDTLPMGIRVCESPMFLTPPDQIEEEFTGSRRPFMARFYEKQRKRMDVLLNADGSPRGGSWSFDDQNRKPMPKSGLEVPPETRVRKTPQISEATDHIEQQYPNYFGQTDSFRYPVTHGQAERHLDQFLEEKFHLFGDYEDAFSRKERVLFHSILTPALNTGLLTPKQVLDRTLEFADEKRIQINNVEGFVRQLIGWREFMKGAYEHLGTKCRTSNHWGFDNNPIPKAFYEGTTGIEPLDIVIGRVLEHGWCHHIERLMVVGNFMLLCGFHPDRVYDWFMELFVDAYDWVMVPNVYGMSQFADGGLFTTKPYISGSNYILKMSDFKRGDWCKTWDGLFWSFVANNFDFFESQPRLGMMAKNLKRMSEDKVSEHRSNAETFLQSL